MVPTLKIESALGVVEPTESTPATLDVAIVDVAIKYEARTKSSKEPMPATANFQFGELVPIPTLPFANTVIRVEVAVPPVVDAIVKSGVLAAVFRLFEMERIE